MDRHKHYIQGLYPLQDAFLKFLDQHNPGVFYLTGGTALSRCYTHHRFSDDLDFFTMDELKDFRPVMANVLHQADRSGFVIKTETISDNFFRVHIAGQGSLLKVDFVNEHVFHYGSPLPFPIFSTVDNITNILANKISCITRFEVKDIADIWAIALHSSFSWRETFDIANKKSPIDPLETSRIIQSLPLDELKIIRWEKELPLEHIYTDLQIIASDIILGKPNSLRP